MKPPIVAERWLAPRVARCAKCKINRAVNSAGLCRKCEKGKRP